MCHFKYNVFTLFSTEPKKQKQESFQRSFSNWEAQSDDLNWKLPQHWTSTEEPGAMAIGGGGLHRPIPGHVQTTPEPWLSRGIQQRLTPQNLSSASAPSSVTVWVLFWCIVPCIPSCTSSQQWGKIGAHLL